LKPLSKWVNDQIKKVRQSRTGNGVRDGAGCSVFIFLKPVHNFYHKV
jgi:hypothetical protein